MKNKQYLKSFDSFSGYDAINEMASELSKLGVPKSLMRFIHKLEGEKFHHSYSGEKQLDPRSGKLVGTFHTRTEPEKAKGGPWPAREDVPLAHDVQVIGTKTGKKNVFYYLTEIIESRKDVGIRMILVNPSQDQIHYITRKTGKIDQAEVKKRGWMPGQEGREQARQAGISQKRGLYLRSVTIDKDSGLPIAAWVGTIGQMAEDWDDNTVLYILEPEDKVRAKRQERKAIKTVTPDQFLEHFVQHYSETVDKLMSTSAGRLRKEFAEVASSITPEDMQEKMDQLNKLMDEIKKNKADMNSLKPKLWNFLELANKKGKYEADEKDVNKADLTDMVNKHTYGVVESMFLQFIVAGKVSKEFYSDDPIKKLGLEDLF